MEVLGDLGFCDPKVSDINSLYLEQVNDSENMARTSRPSSTASFGSWTFSPIQEEESGEILDLHMPVKSDPLPANQQLYLVSNQPMNNQPSAAQRTVNYNHQQLHQTNNTSSEYHYPNTITYHQSVNIHNYVGNYCGPQPVLRDACMWEGLGQKALPAHEPCQNRNNSTPMLRVPEHVDPLAAIAAQGMDFTRCSTPEYLMALNSLNQLDSPPRPNHSAAMDFSCSSSFDEPTNLSHQSVKQQDSGYNSDLNVSPVIQYQDNHAKMADKQAAQRHTSTPNPYQQYLTIAPMQLFHKDTTNHQQHHGLANRFPMMVPGFKPKVMCSNKPVHVVPQPCYPAARFNPVQQTAYRFPTHMPEDFHKLIHTAAMDKSSDAPDYHTSKKKEVKQKPKCEPKVSAKPIQGSSKPTSTTAGLTSRRRHNEPLNNQALEVMNEWYQTHKDNPYPSKVEKEIIAKNSGISVSQVKSWFANKRNRNNNTRPKKQKQVMEERLMDLCHELARDARRPTKDNAYYIQQLSSIIDTTKPHQLM